MGSAAQRVLLQIPVGGHIESMDAAQKALLRILMGGHTKRVDAAP